MKIVWDATGAKKYETGTDHGVLYPATETGDYGTGVAWNGLTAVTETPSGAEASDMWADNIKYASLRSAEAFGGTIEAYTYPDEFGVCDGSAMPARGVKVYQQSRRKFGFCYRTAIGSDTLSDYEKSYLLHLVYGATASPSERAYQTINDSPDAITFSWEFETVPVNVEGYKATALMTIDSTTADPKKLEALEKILYGDEKNEPRLPMPDEVLEVMADTLGELSVSAEAGDDSSHTKLTVSTAKLDPSNVYKVKSSGQEEEVTYGMDVTSWTDWDGNKESAVETSSGQTVTVVEATKAFKAVAKGSCQAEVGI